MAPCGGALIFCGFLIVPDKILPIGELKSSELETKASPQNASAAVF
jgi:hypothetical protein